MIRLLTTGTVFAVFFGWMLAEALGRQFPSEYKFHVHSPEGGFYYDGIKSVRQDMSGFIWVLMDNDLYRYDGYQHQSYYSRFKNLNPSTNWKFNMMDTDTLGRLYVVANNRLFVHHAVTNRFECLLDSTVTFLHIDRRNRIWLKTPDLCLYHPESGTLTPMLSDGMPVPNIFAFWYDGDQLYASSFWGTIYRVEPEKGEFIRQGRLTGNRFYTRMVWNDQSIWACCNENKLHRFAANSYEMPEVYDFVAGSENRINALYIDRQQNVWLGTHRGLYVFNPQTGDHLLFRNVRDDPFSIPNNSVWCIHEDRRQNIWIGTYSGALCYINPNEKSHFISYSPKETGLNHRVVSGFAETERELWIATEGGGINVMDKKTGAFSYKRHLPGENSLAFNNVKQMLPDSAGKNIRIAMFRGGLDSYHIPSGKFTNYKNILTDENSLRNNDLRKIVSEPDSGLWIAYQTDKLLLSCYSFERRDFDHYSFGDPSGKNYIFDICRNPATDDLWIVTHRKMYRMNVKDKKWKEIPYPNMLNGQAVCVDSEQHVWIGTIGKGLVKYSAKDSCFHIYDDILKFRVSSIYSICPDRYGCLWMGTDNGLFRFDPTTGVFMQFTQDDGVQGRVFYPLAAMQGVSGELYFGTTMGFTVITDPDVRINTDRPKAMISDILVNHHSILFNSASHTGIGTEKGLTLKHNMTNVGFLFSSDNYLIPSKNRFKYRLLGYDNRWIETDASNRFAFYTKLPPGHYTLELTTANNDGLWSDEPLRLNIRRLPAPWLGPFALTAYIVLAFVALFAVFRHYDRQKQLKMALYRENFEKRQREELHQSQLSFFTSISHEFKTPLSLILAVTETLRREGLREDYFRILDNNAGRLHQLVNELMLFRTVESGKQPLHIESVNVNALVTGIAEDFSDFARQHRFNYSIHPDRDLPEKIPADRMLLEKIVINLLNNALSYTPDGGSVSITIYSDPKRYIPPYRHSHHEGNDPVDDPFYIVVHDTGVGISESSIRKIFERFYKVKTSDSQHLGTGIGLALVKSLTLLHKGSITVYSEREKGADMVVALSKNAANYRKQDFMEPASPVEDLPADVAPEAKNDIRFAESGNVEDLFLRENKRILIVEDNEDLRKLIVGFLSPYYTVVAASDGVAASDAIRDMEIDLIISDVMMPLKDGITLCRELKDSMNTSHIPLIMLTAKTGQTSRLEGIESGADVYLEKPVNFDMLLQVIRNIFKRQEKLREHYAKYFFVESSEISLNRQDNAFLKKLYDLLDANIDNPELDVNYIASEMTMSKSKIYAKLKSVTGKSLVEIVLDYRLKKAAQLMLEEDLSVREVIMRVGIESQSYFTRMFKKEHGETPAAFAARHKKG